MPISPISQRSLPHLNVFQVLHTHLSQMTAAQRFDSFIAATLFGIKPYIVPDFVFRATALQTANGKHTDSLAMYDQTSTDCILGYMNIFPLHIKLWCGMTSTVSIRPAHWTTVR